MQSTPESILEGGQRRVARRATELVLVASVVAPVLASLDPGNDPWLTAAFYGPALVISLGLWWAARRDRVALAGWGLSLLVFAITTMGLIALGGIQHGGAIGYLVPVTLAATLLGRTQAVGFAFAAIAVATLLTLVEAYGALPPPIAPPSLFNVWLAYVLHFGIMAYLLYLSLELRQRALDAAAEHERAREAAQADLIQAQKLEVVGRLSASVAHDFNNLLNVVLNGSILLAGAVGPEDRDLVDVIEQSARRGALLTSRLLAFGRPRQPEPRLTDLGRVVRELAPLLDRLVGDEVGMECSAHDGATAHIDPVSFEQVLLNLVVNAKEAIDGAGSVLVRTFVDDGSVVLEVADSGSGIPEELRGRIFEPFFTTKTLGTGLGLDTVHRLVATSGGQIEVSDAEEGGAQFRVLWPHVPSAEEAATPAPPAVTEVRSLRVLVVDDNELVRHATVRSMAARGWRVTPAADGLEALSLLARNTFDVLVTDHAMPGLVGAELAVRALEEWPDLPVLLVSGNPLTEVPPGVCFLAKPYDQNELVAAVRSIVADPARRSGES